MKHMRNKVFSIVIGALACGVLALPALAQGSSGTGIGHWFYDALFGWLDVLTLDEPEASPHIPPGGLAAAGSSSEAVVSDSPGGAQTPLDPANAAPYTIPGGQSLGSGGEGGGGEASPHIPPGG